MAKRTSKNAQPQKPKKTRDAKLGIVTTPPDHIQQALFKRNGLWYHSIFCCKTEDPHWGVVISSELLPEQPCGGGGGGLHALAKSLGATKFQSIEYENDELPHHKKNWTVASIGSLYQVPSGVASVVAAKCSLIFKWNRQVSFSNSEFKHRTFDLHIFAHTVPYLTENDSTEKTYLFALADGCTVDSDADEKFNLQKLNGAGVDDDYPIFVGMTKFDLYFKEKDEKKPKPKSLWTPVVVISTK